MVSDGMDDGSIDGWKNDCLMSLDGGGVEYECSADNADGDDECLEDVMSIEKKKKETTIIALFFAHLLFTLAFELESKHNFIH